MFPKHILSTITRTLLLCSGIWLIFSAAHAEETTTARFHGTLVEAPCSISTGNEGENISVDFGSIPDKTFYSNKRTWAETFTITLLECDISVGTQVKITFTGPEDAEQPGLLSISSGNGISHVAIGLLSADGRDILINQQTTGYKLTSGTNQLAFSAYVQASDSAMQAHNVGLGPFKAISTFMLEYP